MRILNTHNVIQWMFGLMLCIMAQPTFAQARLTADEPDSTIVAPAQIAVMDSVDNSKKIAEDNAKALQQIEAPADTASLNAKNAEITKKSKKVKLPKKQFVPDPQRALWLSLVLPGAGQIYNKKYWKLPILYGGFLGCTYALLWNQQMYMDYSQAYLDIMDDDPNTDSYLDMLPPRYDITGKEERFKKVFKNKKDHFRRYRDLSAFCFVGVYLLSVVDAYVDAQLSVFDITPDLSLRLEPAVIQQKGATHNGNAYGVGCSLNF